MKLCAVQFGFAVVLGGALTGLGGAVMPAAAQSYLSDGSSSGSVTVDYSVLGQGAPAGAPAAYDRVGGLSSGATGTCSCAGAPLGVIASAPQPTFSNPFANAQAMAAPAIPPGFMPYSQAMASAGASGSNSSGRVVLTPPSPQSSGTMSSGSVSGGSAAGGAEMEPMPSVEGNQPQSPITGAETTSVASLPATTPTQSESQPAATGEATAGAPPAPETLPTEVPSPVPQQMANVAPPPAAAGTENQAAAPAPAQPAPAAPATTETPAPSAPAPEAQTPATTENQPAAAVDNQASPENQAAPSAPETPTPPAADNQSAASAENEQQASVTPPAPSTDNGAPSNNGGALPAGAYRIAYQGDSDDVPAASTADLDKVAQAMRADENMRVQVLAYAAGTPDAESKARRKSLARGLAVRSYLIKAGIRSTRIDVRALGTKADGGPADRVDVIPAS